MDLIVRLGQSPSPPSPLQQHHGRPNCLTCPKEEGIKASRRRFSSRSAIKHCSSHKSEDLLVPGKMDSDDASLFNCQSRPHIPAERLGKPSGTCASAETSAVPMHFSKSVCVWGCSDGDYASRSKASQPQAHLLKLGGSTILFVMAIGTFPGLADISRADLDTTSDNGHGENGGFGTGGGGRGHGDGGGSNHWDSPGSNDAYAGSPLVDSNVSEQETKEEVEISEQRAQTDDILSSHSEHEDVPATLSYEESAEIFDSKLNDSDLCKALSTLEQKIMHTAMKMIYLNLVAQDTSPLSESESSLLLSLESVQMLQSSGGSPVSDDDIDDETVNVKQTELQGFIHAGKDVSYQGQGIMHGALKKHQPSFEEHWRSGLGKVESQKDTVTDVRKDGDQLPQSESESSSEGLGSEQKQGVMNWLSGIAQSFVTKPGGSQIQLLQREHLTEERVKELANDAIATALNQLTEVGGSSALAKRSETETLKRLQREAFSDLLKLRERLERIEQLSRTGRADASGNLGAARTKLKGDVKAGTAFVILEDSSSRHSRSSLEQAGMLTGLDIRFTFETPFREKDVLITQCVAGQGSSVGDGRTLGGPVSIRKVHYIAQLTDDISISFVPFGAEGKDVTEIINPLQDQGLTAFSSNGPSLFSYCKGSALGATVSGSRCAFSFAQYLSGWGNQIAVTGGPAATESDPLCLSSMAQILLQPFEGLILSFCGLNRYWPTPPLPSSAGLHWSEMGPLVIPKIWSVHKGSSSTISHVSPGSSFSHANSPSPDWMDSNSHFYMDALESKGTSLLSVGVASELDLAENVSIGGWAQLERGDLLQDSGLGGFQWGLNLSKNSGTGIDWGASIGSAKPDFWSMAMNDQDSYPSHDNATGSICGSQLHLEAFVKLYCGRGFTLQPGLLYLVNQCSSTPAVVIRSSWAL